MSDNLNTRINYNQVKCSKSGIRFFDASGTKYVGLRPTSEALEESYDLVFPKVKGVSGEALLLDGSGEALVWARGIGDKGDQGDIGNKGATGEGGLNLWHENWTMPSENTNNQVTVENDHIYFQAFWVDTTGDYTNIKFRCFDKENGAFGVGGSKILAGIYKDGYVPPGVGAAPWDPSNVGGPGMPWPNIKIAEGSKQANINVDDGFWVDISLNTSITLTRNEIYFLAFKAGQDPSSNSWRTIWYGIDNVNDASGMSMLWVRDTAGVGNTDWETLPSLSYGSETIDTVTTYYPPIRNDKGLWFIVYGPQTATGASKGITGQKGATGTDGNNGAKGDDGAKGLQGAAGTGLTNCGNWASGTTYAPGCYVFYATSGANSTIAMWILEGTESYTSTIFPYDDPEHWILFEAPSGQDGAKGAPGVNGAKGAAGTDGTDGAKGEKGVSPSGDKGDKGQKGINGIQGAKGIDGTAGTKGNDGTAEEKINYVTE